MASKHGEQAWRASMASKHGEQAWRASMASKHGEQAWRASLRARPARAARAFLYAAARCCVSTMLGSFMSPIAIEGFVSSASARAGTPPFGAVQTTGDPS
jgi:hypothetical protein